MKILFYAFALIVGLFASSYSQAQGTDLTLQQFLDKVKNESPDFAMERANVNAANARASGIRINPPMIGYMQMREGANTQDGFEIAQEIPFPTKIYTDRKARHLEFKAQKENSNYQTAVILAEARIAFVDYWSAYERLLILKERSHWLKHHVKLARASTRSDSSAQLHLLEVESESDLTENELLALEAELMEKGNKLKSYAPSINVDSVTPKAPSLVSVEVRDSDKSPLMAWKEKELAMREAQVSLKQQSYVPDLFVRFRSFDKSEMAPQSQELMVGITVPFLYFWQPKAEVAEASAQRAKAEAELQKTKIEFISRLRSLIKKSEAIKSQLTTLNEKLIPRAEKRRKLVTTLSQRTMEGLDEHRSVRLGLLDLRMKAVDLRLEYENTFAEIVKLTGVKSKTGSL